ncbi:MAG: translation initiation factor IF-2, partial [Methanobacteriota archaeon]
VILYDGTLSVGDDIVMASRDGTIETKVRSLLLPGPLKEIRIEERFKRVKTVMAAAGIKVAAPNLDGVIAGSPLRVVRKNRDDVVADITKEMQQINVELSDEGVSVKADTIGALEALSQELKDKGIGVRKAEVGPVTRHDIVEAGTIKNPLYSAVLSFNTPILPDASEILKDPSYAPVRVFASSVIYRLIEEYITWKDQKKRELEAKQFEQIVLPAKIALLPHCVFRQSNPAVVGVRVLGGKLSSNVDLIDQSGRPIGHLKTIQERQENIHEADAGAEVAVSIEGPTIGRQINVGDVLYVDVPERHVKVLEHEMLSHLNASMREILEEFTTMKRKGDPFWGK